MSEALLSALPPTNFTRCFLRKNGMDSAAFRDWAFTEGMGFGSTAVWWGMGGKRPHPHEGVDLCTFFTGGGERRGLSAGALVPALYSGVVRGVATDFVDRTIWVRHGDYRTGPWTLHTVYAHVTPLEGVMPGALLMEGEVVASVAASARQTAPPPHLHLSVALVHDAVGDDVLDWGRMHGEPGIRFLDPGPLLLNS